MDAKEKRINEIAETLEKEGTSPDLAHDVAEGMFQCELEDQYPGLVSGEDFDADTAEMMYETDHELDFKKKTSSNIQRPQTMTTSDQIEAMKLEQLRRIAASLEKISGSVELLEKLSDCVSENQYGGFFSVSGNVTADVR